MGRLRDEFWMDEDGPSFYALDDFFLHHESCGSLSLFFLFFLQALALSTLHNCIT